ncbi:MAG: carboxypeptidase regulatory-like domain-containing protein [Acidobacteriota bacterium]
MLKEGKLGNLKRSLFAGLILSLLLCVPAWAQETGTITGTVSDPDGAPLPGVAVTIGGSLVPESTVYTQANGHFRFVALPPGNDYTLTFALEGFATVVQEEISVRVGGNTSANVTMDLSTVEETVTVTGTTPIVDVKSTSTGANITEEYMQSIPSARDPWVMMEQTAGIQTDRANVGGSESGQQSGYSARGSAGSDSVWTYDGAEMTDMAATGASTTYFDFGAFEEIAVTTGGADPSKMTGGVQINFVTKRGGNDWRAGGRFYLTDEEFQSENIDDVDGELFPGFDGGNRINQVKDFGGEIGGPVIEDRFFVWGAYGKQEIELFVGQGDDNTDLENWHAQGTFHLTGDTVINYTFMRANKTKAGRDASATLNRHSAYVGDTYTSGRWTLNLGVRYDNQKTEELEGRSPGNPIAPVVDGVSTLPELTFDGFDPGFAWESFSPRFGLTYDLSGDATTVEERSVQLGPARGCDPGRLVPGAGLQRRRRLHLLRHPLFPSQRRPSSTTRRCWTG